jgi:hypothetical protein
MRCRCRKALAPALGLALFAVAVPAAPPLPDPTQPPPVRTAAAAGPRPTARASAPAPRPRVTSILVTRRGEASAWVDGRLVRPGERLPGGETIARIDAQGVTLQGPRGEQRLWLLADVAAPARTLTPESTPASHAVELAERSRP